MSNAVPAVVSLKFALEVDDGWPPVAVESLPFHQVDDGYEVQNAPLFIKDLSVGDVIAASVDADGTVAAWRHVRRSLRTTLWFLRLKRPSGIDEALVQLRHLGCNTVGLDEAGAYAVDIPEAVSMEDVDQILDTLNRSAAAVAFPSMRHPE